MVTKYAVELGASYQDTKTYREASPERRRQLNRYKKECDISDEQMLLILAHDELANQPKDKLEKANTTSTIVLLVAVLLFFNSMSAFTSMSAGTEQMVFFVLSFVSFLLAIGVYFSGALNPYKRTLRQVDKRLKELPDVPDFVQWDMDHPSRQDRKARRC